MSDAPANGGKKQVWITVAIVVAQGLIQWGITYATLTEHTRRLEEMHVQIQLIEKRQEENLLSRVEYDKRHADLQDDLRELRREVIDLEKKVR